MNNNPPQSIDEIIEKILGRALDVANDNDSDPKAVCALGWLVLKIKQIQLEAAAKNKPLAAVVTDDTLRQIEREGKIE